MPVLIGFDPGVTLTVRMVLLPACTVLGFAEPVPDGGVVGAVGVALAGAFANVFRSANVAVVRGGDAGAVDADAKPGGSDSVNPGVDVGLLLGQHASALLLIEKDDGVRGESFAACGGSSGVPVGIAQFSCVGNGFQFGVEAPVEEDEKSEAGGFHGGAVACPCIGALAGRAVEPVAGIGESLAEGFKAGVAGVVVAVEAEVGLGARLGR